VKLTLTIGTGVGWCVGVVLLSMSVWSAPRRAWRGVGVLGDSHRRLRASRNACSFKAALAYNPWWKALVEGPGRRPWWKALVEGPG